MTERRPTRILVTGGAGFIGSHVVPALVADGCDVEIIDNLSTGKRENVAIGARLHEIDVRSSEAANLAASGRFDAVVHLAAQMDVRKSVADPRFDSDVNIGGTINVMEALRRAHSKARVVFASTGGALYGDHAAAEPRTPRKEPTLRTRSPSSPSSTTSRTTRASTASTP